MARLAYKAKERATKRGLPFSISVRNSLISNPPSICDCCNKKLDYSLGHGRRNNKDSPSLDRLDNNKGYTKENTRVICFRCNELKNNGTLEELKTIVSYIQREIGNV